MHQKVKQLLQLLLVTTIWANVTTCSSTKCGSPNPVPVTLCSGDGWVAYNDEKCFKLIEDYANRDKAETICNAEFSSTTTPTLVSIKSQSEQDFIVKHLFETSKVDINVWTGARRLNGGGFVWADNSSLEYANWAEGGPSDDANRKCVVIESGLIRRTSEDLRNANAGKWRDVTCNAPSYILCEKLQSWSLIQLQQTLLNARKKLGDSLSATQTELDSTRNDLKSATNKLNILEKNPIPIGFIYAQLPSQPEPGALWPNVKWSDVTTQYAGNFFRAEGGGSEAFGLKQTENSPRLTDITLFVSHYTQVSYKLGAITPGQRTINFVTGDDGAKAKHGMSLLVSGGEVRPKNMAFRVWKRIE